jgi:hypothetical protein
VASHHRSHTPSPIRRRRHPPLQYLLDCLYRATALVRVCETLANDADLKKGLAYRTKAGELVIHPYVRQYERALDREAKYAGMCLDAGVSERQQQLVEMLGEQLGVLFERTIGAIDGLTRAQRAQAAEAYALVVAELEQPRVGE